jgi:hypothetical protein
MDINRLLSVGLETTIPVFETQAKWAQYEANNDRKYFELFTSMTVQVAVFGVFVLKMEAVCCSSEIVCLGL